MREYDLVIVGGGPAGLAAAAAAKDSGIDSILILERDRELGGILNQCIHNGFGLHTFKEELTGPEYAARFIERVRERKIEYKLNTMVMEISPQKAVTAMNREEGLFEIKARAVKDPEAHSISPAIVRLVSTLRERPSGWSIWKASCLAGRW